MIVGDYTAMQYKGTENSYLPKDLVLFLAPKPEDEDVYYNESNSLVIHRLKGRDKDKKLVVEVNDWILKDKNGEFTIVSPETFEKIYLRGGKMSFEKYTHWKKEVTVRSDLKSKHKDYCLCYSCERFRPGSVNNCHIAQDVYNSCVKWNIVTPMWECPKFIEKEADVPAADNGVDKIYV